MGSRKLFLPLLSLFVSNSLRFSARPMTPSQFSRRSFALSSSNNEKNEGHRPPSNAPKMTEEEMRINQLIQVHQSEAVQSRLDFPTAVRTLVQFNHGYAVISTNSASEPGYPSGSVVGFAPDEKGRPIFLFSTMSGHTNDVLADPRCSLTVADIDFKGAADGRVSLMGKCHLLGDEEREAAKAVYAAKHPNAFWMSFGDFTFYRMEVEAVRFVGGFAMAGGVGADEYLSATIDPLKEFSRPICSHMNDDHESATIGIVKNEVGIEVETAKIASVDSQGMEVICTQPGGIKMGKLRIPFLDKATNRADVKKEIVRLTKAASSSGVVEEK